MKKFIQIAYYFHPNLGSEKEVGFNFATIASKINKLNYVIIPYFFYQKIFTHEKVFNNIAFGKINEIKIISFKKLDFPFLSFERISFMYWLIIIQFILLYKKKKNLHFTTPVQAFLPIFTQYFVKTIIGPMHIYENELEKNKFFFKNILSFILQKIYLPIKFTNRNNSAYFFDTPNKKFKGNNFFIISSHIFYKFDKFKNTDNKHERKNIIFAGRDIKIKNLKLHLKLFSDLSNEFINNNFIIYTDVKNNINLSNNLKICKFLERSKFFYELKKSQLLVFLSSEGGGMVAIESVTQGGCPVFSMLNSGSNTLLNNSDKFTYDRKNDNYSDLLHKLKKIINNNELLKSEYSRQYSYFKNNYSFMERDDIKKNFDALY